MQPQTKRSPVLILIFVAIGVAVVGLTLFLNGLQKTDDNNSDSQSGAITDITVRVVPTDSNVKINGKGIKSGATALDPGTYTVAASRKGFESQSRTVTIQQGDHIIVGLILSSNDESTADYYEKNASEAREAEGITGQQSATTAGTRINKLPLLKVLPRRVVDRYSITYGQSLKKPNDSTASVIYIQYVDEKAKTAAQNWIRYQGYNPDELEIDYSIKSGI